jgi:hypothetical protein
MKADLDSQMEKGDPEMRMSEGVASDVWKKDAKSSNRL